MATRLRCIGGAVAMGPLQPHLDGARQIDRSRLDEVINPEDLILLRRLE